YIAPGGGATSIPGRRASSVTSTSRAASSPARVRATQASPSVTAATPARWTKTGEHDVLYSISLPRSGISDGGATIQPSRQPVISQALEKLLVLTRRSSGSARSRKDGAQRPPV